MLGGKSAMVVWMGVEVDDGWESKWKVTLIIRYRKPYMDGAFGLELLLYNW